MFVFIYLNVIIVHNNQFQTTRPPSKGTRWHDEKRENAILPRRNRSVIDLHDHSDEIEIVPIRKRGQYEEEESGSYNTLLSCTAVNYQCWRGWEQLFFLPTRVKPTVDTYKVRMR
mmetsp:Transcript_32847/g.49644  ORF Transcript_32847/g.49644 Transcript_32847/m.49644 type:complete len:115 (+) Transcript_32847:99-443(+)